jgi:hypothetical protein
MPENSNDIQELKINLSRDNAQAESTPEHLIYTLCQPVYNGVILHPSLGCPLLVDHEHKNRLSLFLAAGGDFYHTFTSGAIGAQGGNPIKLVVAAALKVIPWDEKGVVLKHPGKVELIYPDRQIALANISCTLIGEIGIELNNSHGHHFANLRQSTLSALQQQGLSHCYQITLTDLPVLQGAGLYEAFWTVRNEQPADGDLDQTYLNSSDRLLRQYVHKHYYGESQSEKQPPLNAYRIDSKRGLSFEADNATPLIARHPIYIAAAGKSKLCLGHLSDVHLSSKQYCYKGKGATVIPGVDEAVSPPIGDMANNNGDNFHDLLQQMGSEVDAVIITGDLYDHLHNYDPTLLNSDKTGKLWEAMYLETTEDVTKKRRQDFPYGIDGLCVYSLLIDFYNRHKKPVWITSGNHEAYEFPYGISPRILGYPVNEGVPLDHNLTIYEAILLYGPGYKTVLKKLNFDEDNFDCFYTLFTPLTDCWQIFGDQCLLGLEWGDGEDIGWSLVRTGGTLPRASDSLDQTQQSLVQSALDQNKESILFSHFTVVNYSLKKALSDQGYVNVGQATLTAFDHGSCTNSRTDFYGRIINHPNLKLSLSGHSHRVGLYRFDPHYAPLGAVTGPMVTSGYGLSGQIDVLTGGKTRALHPEDAMADSFARDQTRLLVSASTGPIPKQNHAGEMKGQGMEKPSGSKIDEAGTISLIKGRLKAAQPRFCVACDYIDIMKDGFWEYFKAVGSDGTFEMKPYWEKIHPNLSTAVKEQMIESVTLYLVGKVNQTCTAKPKLQGNETLSIKLGKELKRRMKENFKVSAFFLSIKFSDAGLKNLIGFKDYDFSSPWNIQVGIYKQGLFKKEVDFPNTKNDSFKWQIMRHKKHGEIPYFDWRADTMPSEFTYELKKRES